MSEKENIEVLKKSLFEKGPEALDIFLSGYMLEEETTDWYRKSFIEELIEYAVEQMSDDELKERIAEYNRSPQTAWEREMR